jgi:hypothetical protein
VIAFDHAILAVRDFDLAAADLLSRRGLASIHGGHHPGHGTGNRIVPLGQEYLELMAVVDEKEALSSPLGRRVLEWTAERDRPAMLCLRTDDIDALGSRLGLDPLPMTRLRPDGIELAWRLLGLEHALRDGVPFFIQWDIVPEYHPAREYAAHVAEPIGIAWAEFGGDHSRLDEWLGDHELDIRKVAGEPGLQRVGLATLGGEIVLA